jgi:hypothetical protein
VKANSIEGSFFSSFVLLKNEGNKLDNIDVVFTPWSNLKKTPSMDVGQVGFKDDRMVCW